MKGGRNQEYKVRKAGNSDPPDLQLRDLVGFSDMHTSFCQCLTFCWFSFNTVSYFSTSCLMSTSCSRSLLSSCSTASSSFLKFPRDSSIADISCCKYKQIINTVESQFLWTLTQIFSFHPVIVQRRFDVLFTFRIILDS